MYVKAALTSPPFPCNKWEPLVRYTGPAGPAWTHLLELPEPSATNQEV